MYILGVDRTGIHWKIYDYSDCFSEENKVLKLEILIMLYTDFNAEDEKWKNLKESNLYKALLIKKETEPYRHEVTGNELLRLTEKAALPGTLQDYSRGDSDTDSINSTDNSVTSD